MDDTYWPAAIPAKQLTRTLLGRNNVSVAVVPMGKQVPADVVAKIRFRKQVIKLLVVLMCVRFKYTRKL